MKKNLIFILLSLVMFFSLGFLPAPSNEVNNPLAKPTNSALASLTVTNNTKRNITIWLYGTKKLKYYSFSMSAASGITKKINLVPDTYQISIYYRDSVECKPMKKIIKITTKTKLKLTCAKSGFKD